MFFVFAFLTSGWAILLEVACERQAQLFGREAALPLGAGPPVLLPAGLKPDRGNLILVLGILSILLGSMFFPLGIAAWGSLGFGIFAKLSLLFIALMALAVTAQAGDGKGNNGNPGVLPPQANAYGQSYGEWAAEWWQWAWSIPADQNPLIDTTGEFAAVGQEGNVWFLAGDIGGTVVRDVTLPAGKALFFPIMNQSWIQFSMRQVAIVFFENHPTLSGSCLPGPQNTSSSSEPALGGLAPECFSHTAGSASRLSKKTAVSAAGIPS